MSELNHLEKYLLEHFADICNLLPLNQCKLSRGLVEGSLTLLLDCPNSAFAESLYGSRKILKQTLGETGFAEQIIILVKGRAYFPALLSPTRGEGGSQ